MLLENLSKYQIVLASQSARRGELLAGMGLTFSRHPSEVDETLPLDVPFENIAEHFAKCKAEDVAQHYNKGKTFVIGGDTTVLFEGELLEKPQSPTEAFDMLKQLSGKTHTVISGICLVHKNKILADSDTAKVSFDVLRDEDIHFYIDKYAPFDKAGSYGIQEWIGYIGINRIEGSFYTVMGLPTHLLWNMFKKITNPQS
jgi:septum formation protein